MIYLDYAATTPADSRVVEKMCQFLGADSCFANPASRSHMLGWQAEAAVEKSRKQLSNALNCDVREIVWTSGATESNNLAIKGIAEHFLLKGDSRRHIVTSKVEHKAVLDVYAYLETKGYRVTLLDPDSSGRISTEDVKGALTSDTLLVSVMHVNNETGVINPVEEIAALCKSEGAFFHADCAQSVGKIPIDLATFKADMISLCAHKIYGPKGIGALFVRRNDAFSITSQIHGGGHERGMRSGTLPTHQIVGFSEALRICVEGMAEEQVRIRELKRTFYDVLGGDCATVNGSLEHSVSGIINLSFPGIDGQMLLTALPNLAISSGSACNSASMAPSHVLKAMGLSDDDALSALRFSFGRFTQLDQVTEAAMSLKNALSKLA